MYELTDRQIKLLKAIVEEYINTAEPVGSLTLEKRHTLGVSPATIRNEMVTLTKNGFLKQPHTSAGRVPTPLALKFYIQNLMKQQEMSVTDEVKVKEKIWDYRQKQDKLLREATRALADKTHVLALSTTNDGDLYYAGASNLLDMLEFYDMVTTKNLLYVLDQFDFWWDIFGKSEYDNPYHVLFGEELRQDKLLNCSMVYSLIQTPKLQGAIAAVGPSRMDFSRVIPTVSYFGNLLTEISRQW
jgi:heat-inducible transcriptional repressor